MKPHIIPKKGKRGRHRWLAQDAADHNMTVAMSPRDWETAESATLAGEELLEARAKPLRDKMSRLEAVARDSRQAYKTLADTEKEHRHEVTRLRALNAELRQDIARANQAVELAGLNRKRDKRAVIIAYTVVFAAILVGVACIALNGIFCAA